MFEIGADLTLKRILGFWDNRLREDEIGDIESEGTCEISGAGW